MKHVFRLTLSVGLLLAAGSAVAADTSPVGTWKTIDDATHQAKSLVRISESHGELQGEVMKILQSSEGPNPVCAKCDGERKNQPIEGMTILWGVSKDGDVWDGGKILDPKNGKTYKVKLTVTDGGQKLDVHGYVGFALLGRTQTWERQE